MRPDRVDERGLPGGAGVWMWWSWRCLWWRGQSRMRLSSSVAPPSSTGMRWCASSSRVAVQPGYWQCAERLCKRALLGVGRAAPDARVHEIATAGLDGEAARVAGEPRGRLEADRAGAFEQRRRILAEVHDERRRTAPHTPAGSAALGERHERVSSGLLPVQHDAGLLVDRALFLGDAPDGLLERGALLERQSSADRELALPARPGHAQRTPLVQRLVVVDLRRSERARSERDIAGCLADGDACELGISARRRELRSSGNLIERQRTATESLVERRQAPQSTARLRKTSSGAVLAAGNLREPSSARRAPRGQPILLVVGRAHDLREPLIKPRALLAKRPHLTPPRQTTPLQRLIDRLTLQGEHLFVFYPPRPQQSVPK